MEHTTPHLAATASITLYIRNEKRDAVYSATLDGGAVTFSWGRRGATPASDTKHLPPDAARKLYDKKVREKLNEGYAPGDPAERVATQVASTEPRSDYRPMLLNSITPEQAETLICDPDWVMQQKADGVRAIITVIPEIEDVTADSRTSKPVTLTKAIWTALLRSFGQRAVLDTEVCGSTLVIFDMLRDGPNDLREQSLGHRLARMEHLASFMFKKPACLSFIQTARTEQEKRAALKILRDGGAEGVVFKDRRSPYVAGRPNLGGPALKWKFKASASVMVAGPHKGGKRSVEMALGDGSMVGHVTIPAKHGPLPHTGAMIEVEYLYAYRGGALIQPVYKGIREDVAVADGPDKLQYKGESR